MAALFILLAAGAVAAGAPPAIVGKWAASPPSCDKPQDSPEAPTVIHGRTMDQHEASCTFGPFRAAGPNHWATKGSCIVEGSSQGHGTYQFERRGQTLRIREPDTLHPSVLTRCGI